MRLKLSQPIFDQYRKLLHFFLAELGLNWLSYRTRNDFGLLHFPLLLVWDVYPWSFASRAIF